jgi:ABC-type transporter Mla subunit MlaD
MRKSSYAKIGAFVCAAIVLAVAAALIMGAGSMRKRELMLETYVEETVQGVSEGSAVKFRGIPVGSVKTVSFAMAAYMPDPQSPDAERARRYARVVFSIDISKISDPDSFEKLVKEQIDHGLRAHMKSQGVTGLVYVDLDFEDPSKPTLPVPWEPEHLYIPTAPSFVKTLTDVVQNVAHEIHGLSDLKSEVTNLSSKISVLLDKAGATLETADASLADIPGLIAGASNAVADASAFLRAAKDDAAPLPYLLTEASNLVADASAFIASARNEVADVTASSTNFLSGADSTISGLRVPLQNTLEDLSRASKNLADILDAIRDDPGRLFRRPSEEEMP